MIMQPAVTWSFELQDIMHATASLLHTFTLLVEPDADLRSMLIAQWVVTPIWHSAVV